MQPLPKAVGYLAILAAIFGALNTAEVLAVLPKTWATVVTLGAAVVLAVTHSLNGDGGKPQ